VTTTRVPVAAAGDGCGTIGAATRRIVEILWEGSGGACGDHGSERRYGAGTVALPATDGRHPPNPSEPAAARGRPCSNTRWRRRAPGKARNPRRMRGPLVGPHLATLPGAPDESAEQIERSERSGSLHFAPFSDGGSRRCRAKGNGQAGEEHVLLTGVEIPVVEAPGDDASWK
jgi:hypothetical protein